MSTHAHAWHTRLLNSRFFLLSCVLHLILVVTVGTQAIIERVSEPPDFWGEKLTDEIAVVPPDDDNEPPQSHEDPLPPLTRETTSSQITDVIATTGAAAFVIPQGGTAPSVDGLTQRGRYQEIQIDMPNPGGPDRLPADQLKRIRAFTDHRKIGSSRTAPVYEFPVFLAKYAGGDWSSTVELRDGKIAKGSLTNLLWIAGKLSRDRIKGHPVAEPLDLASDELFAKRAPFILITGHRDFVLTEAEVANLTKYIRLGGCIWGDSSLPGHRSRFDIAFRREMKRVVADRDKEFEPLTSADPLFRGKFYPGITSVPPGMNGYQLPVQVLRYYDRICVLYTANDYADFWQFGLDENWKFETRRDANWRMIAMNESLWNRRHTYYHGISEERVKSAYQFGLNIIAHLITQWEEVPVHFPSGL